MLYRFVLDAQSRYTHIPTFKGIYHTLLWSGVDTLRTPLGS
jgi:hypothetical protein